MNTGRGVLSFDFEDFDAANKNLTLLPHITGSAYVKTGESKVIFRVQADNALDCSGYLSASLIGTKAENAQAHKARFSTHSKPLTQNLIKGKGLSFFAFRYRGPSHKRIYSSAWTVFCENAQFAYTSRPLAELMNEMFLEQWNHRTALNRLAFDPNDLGVLDNHSRLLLAESLFRDRVRELLSLGVEMEVLQDDPVYNALKEIKTTYSAIAKEIEKEATKWVEGKMQFIAEQWATETNALTLDGSLLALAKE